MVVIFLDLYKKGDSFMAIDDIGSGLESLGKSIGEGFRKSGELQYKKKQYEAIDKALTEDPGNIDAASNAIKSKEGLEYLNAKLGIKKTSLELKDYESPPQKTDREANRKLLDEYTKQGGDFNKLAQYVKETPDQPMVALSKGFKNLEDKKIATGMSERFMNAVKDFPDVRTKYAQMEDIYAMGKKTGEWGQADQALLVLMQKALDPQSVVRETEFTRSLLTQSWFNQLLGKLEQGVRGGGGLVDDERRKLIEVARKMYRGAEATYKLQRNNFSTLAQSELFQLDPEMVVMQDISIPENFYESGAPKVQFRMKGGKMWKPISYYPQGHPKAGQPSQYEQASQKEIDRLES
jgi:hypothetical protein